jgi:2-polyprenyl-6-methoxyphenol hydroxylase-like FAD-dependent oxidoreductase
MADIMPQVGGGPAGLVLAISLSKNGIPVRIIEKNPHPRVGQRGAGIMVKTLPSSQSYAFPNISIQPRSLELFAGIGIIDKVLQDAITVRRMRKYNADGTQPIEEYDLQPTQDPTPSNPYVRRGNYRHLPPLQF